MKLLVLGFILQVFGYVAVGRVVNSFKESCPQFFIANPSDQNVHYPPTVLQDGQKPERYKQICQLFKNVYRYATLYDTQGRIPVYSAYYYDGSQKTEKVAWKIEPQKLYLASHWWWTLPDGETELARCGKVRWIQVFYTCHHVQPCQCHGCIPTMLDDLNLGPEMAIEATIMTPEKGKKQALKQDYVSHSQEYTRGHVYPRSYTKDQDSADATYTLTNAVPQTQKDNVAWGAKVEMKMMKFINDNCDKSVGHVVTGAVPGSSWMEIKRDNVLVTEGVNIPEHFWTAFCCHDKNTPALVSGAWLASRGSKDLQVRKKTVKQLEEDLTRLYGNPQGAFSMFGGLCQGSVMSRFYYAVTNFLLDIFTT
ncbi:endonuclease domain-containing 1 protein-like [Brachyhypopomus gauderio]|uniref:endonuclease domain-containing 1 protein-like n=1 Tax=Brachyhypopomus gauderio TaxID=698409 RepID=UPI00404315B9